MMRRAFLLMKTNIYYDSNASVVVLTTGDCSATRLTVCQSSVKCYSGDDRLAVNFSEQGADRWTEHAIYPHATDRSIVIDVLGTPQIQHYIRDNQG